MMQMSAFYFCGHPVSLRALALQYVSSRCAERHGTRETSNTGSTHAAANDSVPDEVAKTAVVGEASLENGSQFSGKVHIPQIREAGQETLADAQADMGQNKQDESDTGLSVEGLQLTPRVDAHCDLLSVATFGAQLRTNIST